MTLLSSPSLTQQWAIQCFQKPRVYICVHFSIYIMNAFSSMSICIRIDVLLSLSETQVLLGSYSTQTSVYLNVLANCKRKFIQKYLQVTKTSLKVSHIKSERTNSEHQVLFWPK
jgi:hypothetical protein